MNLLVSFVGHWYISVAFMILIIGLGNPGKKYEKTRHNIGFRVIEKLARKNNFPDFEFSQKFNALISKGKLGKERTILAKPQTFMNNSGKAVKSLMNFYKITSPGLARLNFAKQNLGGLVHQSFAKQNLGGLVVIHDDIDLPLGKIRISKGRGAAGHKGVESIIKELGTKNFDRFRIGIQPKSGKPKNVERFVLQKFTKGEGEIIKEVIEKTCKAAKLVLTERLNEAMKEYNK